MRVNFERPEDICYIGHIDLKTAIERGLRRTLLPLKYTEGFNKRVKLEMGFPLSVGMVGEDEYFDFFVEDTETFDLIRSKIEEAFYGILVIKGIREVTLEAPSLTSLDAILVHYIYAKLDFDIEEVEIEEKIRRIIHASEIIMQRDEKKKDVRPFIENLELLKKEKLNLELLFSIYFTRNGSIRIDEIEKVMKDTGLPVEFEYSVRKRTSVLYKGKIISPFDF